MNARRFDALTVAMTSGAHRASRRRVLRGLAMLAAMGLPLASPRRSTVVRFRCSPPSAASPAIVGADCAAGEICLNGACAPRELSGTGTTGQLVGEPTTGEPAAPGAAPGTTPVTAPETAPPAGVGGLIQPGEPLPARIYAGRCGGLGAEPAFQLIDVGAVEGIEAGEAPQGALTAIPAEFSTTVVNAPLADLLASEHAIDVRVDDADPATSIACGDIGGPIEAGADGDELAVGLQERGNSAYSGIGWLQDEGERTLVRVFLARGLDSADVAAAPQTAAAEVAEPDGGTRRRGGCAARRHPGRRRGNAAWPRSQSRHDDRRQSPCRAGGGRRGRHYPRPGRRSWKSRAPRSMAGCRLPNPVPVRRALSAISS